MRKVRNDIMNVGKIAEKIAFIEKESDSIVTVEEDTETGKLYLMVNIIGEGRAERECDDIFSVINAIAETEEVFLAQTQEDEEGSEECREDFDDEDDCEGEEVLSIRHRVNRWFYLDSELYQMEGEDGMVVICYVGRYDNLDAGKKFVAIGDMDMEIVDKAIEKMADLTWLKDFLKEGERFNVDKDGVLTIVDAA